MTRQRLPMTSLEGMKSAVGRLIGDLAVPHEPRQKIDANALEQMAKERPDEMFLKGSGVLKLIAGIRQLEGELRALHTTPGGSETEMSPEFTDTARAALLWVLWHHQGGSSKVGQPIRFALGMGAHEHLSDYQIREAKRWAALTATEPPREGTDADQA